MTRRPLAAAAAVLLAVVGAVVLIGYVRGADDRARAGEELVPVLVVDSEAAAGSPADSLAVSVQEVPARLAAPGAIEDLSEVTGMVTTAALLPGEQVLAGRFASPSSLAPAGTVLRPDGLVEVSVALEAQRALGGSLKAGDRIGVQITNEESAEGGVSAYSVWRVFNDVLVTRVSSTDSEDPLATVTVTLALSREDAAVVVLGMEAQGLWLSLEQSAPIDTTDQTTATSLGDDS